MGSLLWIHGHSICFIKEIITEISGQRLEYPTCEVLRKHGQPIQTTQFYKHNLCEDFQKLNSPQKVSISYFFDSVCCG
jgi:hypothetical protein